MIMKRSREETMKIRLLIDWMGHRAGDVFKVKPGVGQSLIKLNKAEHYNPVPVVEKKLKEFKNKRVKTVKNKKVETVKNKSGEV